MGIDTRHLAAVARFIYRAQLAGGLVEHELDHVVVGSWSGEPVPDPNEVADWRWISRDELWADLHAHPSLYTAWLPYVLQHAGEPPLGVFPAP